MTPKASIEGLKTAREPCRLAGRALVVELVDAGGCHPSGLCSSHLHAVPVQVRSRAPTHHSKQNSRPGPSDCSLCSVPPSGRSSHPASDRTFLGSHACGTGMSAYRATGGFGLGIGRLAGGHVDDALGELVGVAGPGWPLLRHLHSACSSVLPEEVTASLPQRNVVRTVALVNSARSPHAGLPAEYHNPFDGRES